MHRTLGNFFLTLGIVFLIGISLILTDSASDAFQAFSTITIAFVSMTAGIALLVKSGEKQ